MKTRLGVHAESIRCQITEIDNLKPSLSNNREKLAESKRLLEQEKSDALTKAEKSKEKADVAKSSFEKTRGEVEALLLDFEDLEIQLEVDEIVRAQATMIEETSVKITHLLNGNPELDMIDFEYDFGKTFEERVSAALVDIEKHFVS